MIVTGEVLVVLGMVEGFKGIVVIFGFRKGFVGIKRDIDFITREVVFQPIILFWVGMVEDVIIVSI